MDIEIIKNLAERVALNARGGVKGKLRLKLEALELGDGFFFPLEERKKVATRAACVAQKTGRRFRTSPQSDGLAVVLRVE